jgi:hypothetical protein
MNRGHIAVGYMIDFLTIEYNTSPEVVEQALNL